MNFLFKCIRIFIFPILLTSMLAAPAIPSDEKLLSFTEGWAPVENGNLYYKVFGSKGDPIILLHGGPGLKHNHFMP